MQLELTPDAQKKIQADVDALRRSERYFRMKLERVDLYMPLIEKAFREENVPEDFKYLVIQESALIGDAVSSANAIGYWQFKVAAAEEVGLSINNTVDERMNIVNASHGAARYLKKNNTVYFDNWLYAVLAYNTGPGGALKITDKSKYGVKRMKLDGRTHWYVLKFLAHKIAFENEIGKNINPETELVAYTQGAGKTLSEIAAEFDLTEADLNPYNKWLKKKQVPADKTYFVVLPLKTGQGREELLADASPPFEAGNTPTQVTSTRQTTTIKTESSRFPVIEKHTTRKETAILINGIPGTIALEGENLNKLASRMEVPAKKFRKYNDLDRKGAGIEEGKPYYLKRKRNKAKTHYHIVEPGENLWSISQRFGIKQKKLMRNNRMKKEEALKSGRVLWMRFIRPSDYPVEYQEIPVEKEKTVLAAKQASITQPTSKTQVVEKPAVVEKERKPIAETQPAQKEASSYNPATPDEQVLNQGVKKETELPSVSSSPAPVKDDFEVDKDFAFGNTSPIPAQGRETAIFHTVQSGDTWYGIARKYEVNISELTRTNEMQIEDKLNIGQQLRVPSHGQISSNDPAVIPQKTFPTGKATAHRVKPGETLYSISRHYGVSVKELMDWNQKETFDLNVGEELRVR
jgi:membrane-bound lytic murein transglycosylase D